MQGVLLYLKNYWRRLKNGKPAVAYYLRLFERYYAHSYLPKVTYMDVEEYIHLHKNVKKWVNYCEVLVNRKGKVALAVPSHTDAVYGGNIVTKAKYMYMTPPTEYSTEKLCDDFGVIMVWCDTVCTGRKPPTKEQVLTMYRLYQEGCVKQNCWMRFAALA